MAYNQQNLEMLFDDDSPEQRLENDERERSCGKPAKAAIFSMVPEGYEDQERRHEPDDHGDRAMCPLDYHRPRVEDGQELPVAVGPVVTASKPRAGGAHESPYGYQEDRRDGGGKRELA